MAVRPYRPEDAAAVREEELRLVGLLHATGAAAVSFVAIEEPGGRVVGHVLFSPVEDDGRGLRGLPPSGRSLICLGYLLKRS